MSSSWLFPPTATLTSPPPGRPIPSRARKSFRGIGKRGRRSFRANVSAPPVEQTTPSIEAPSSSEEKQISVDGEITPGQVELTPFEETSQPNIALAPIEHMQRGMVTPSGEIEGEQISSTPALPSCTSSDTAPLRTRRSIAKQQTAEDSKPDTVATQHKVFIPLILSMLF